MPATPFTDPQGARIRWPITPAGGAAEFLGDLVRPLPRGNALARRPAGGAGRQDFQVVAIAAGHNPPRHRKFMTEAKIDNLPVLLDPRQGLAREMGVMGMP